VDGTLAPEEIAAAVWARVKTKLGSKS
jgi:hypothetical protein